MPKRKEDVEFRYYSVDENFPILPLIGNRWESTYGAMGGIIVKFHFHNLMEIGYCHKGEGTLSIEDKKIPYRAGTFTIIPKDVLHDTLSDKGSINFWEYLFVDDGSILKKFYLQNFDGTNLFDGIETNYVVGNRAEDPILADTIYQILNEFKTRDSYYKERANALLLSLFFGVARNEQPKVINDDIVKNRRAIMAVLEYINNKYDESVTVTALAKICNMSEPYFRRVFKTVVGKTPLEHLNKVRVQKACIFLLRDDETIITVAMACGFSSVSTFNRNFIRYVGCTPSEYRQNHTVHRGFENFTIENYPGW